MFEECENERKTNTEEINKLKKEIGELVIILHDTKIPTAKYLTRNKRLEDIIGPLDNKTFQQIQELLDLQIIDKSKQLDLLKYKINQRKQHLSKLGKELQEILCKKDKRQLNETVEKPAKKATSELQNSIHAIEVQLREANHIKERYLDIRKSLKDDAGKFESNIKKLEEEIDKQTSDTVKLQTVCKRNDFFKILTPFCYRLWTKRHACVQLRAKNCFAKRKHPTNGPQTRKRSN